jgi:hypothetical protein
MKFIEIPIECRVPNPAGIDYQELGMDEPEPEHDYRNATLIVDNIVGFYPDYEKEGCLIHIVDGSSLYTNLSYEEMKQRLL